QTVIAASYGLHQVLYETAVGQGYVDSTGVGRAPRDLFDASTSLDLGTQYLAKRFRAQDGADQQDYPDQNDFLFQFSQALRAFNAGDKSVGFDIETAKSSCLQGSISENLLYTCVILNRAPAFNPVPIIGGTGQ